MSAISWYVNRLRAMSPREVLWRLGQKRMQYSERKYCRKPQRVDHVVFNPRLENLRFDSSKLGVNTKKDGHIFGNSIPLLGGYEYKKYKRQWHAGFQTSNEWERLFSYQLDYKGRDDIGDARTNWELNRHFQFAILAKNYYYSGDEKWADELQMLYEDWNDSNPYLIGISWTSVMELAIRSISWCFSLAYLQLSGKHQDLQQHLATGILNMTDAIDRHHSRFSSANNHLIVEAASMAIAGYAFDHTPWKDKGLKILDSEMPKQNYPDGVNKEMSLHYQLFVMEAYALVAHTMVTNGDNVPHVWKTYLTAMCEFVCHSTDSHGVIMEFGDDDEGKILDLEGVGSEHANAVMQLCSLVTGTSYPLFSRVSETARCLLGEGYEKTLVSMPSYDHHQSRCFKEGGYTFLRSDDTRTLIGIDHAPLGFGSIAAHGHSDTLSFQLMEDGEMLLADPGTYIYHSDLNARNHFRKTINHNTLCIDGHDQSEMLGAFLWGKKANCKLLHCQFSEQEDIVEAEHDGYLPTLHRRRFTWNKIAKTLRIDDTISSPRDWTLSFVVGSNCQIEKSEGNYLVRGNKSRCMICLPKDSEPEITTIDFSECYGVKSSAYVLRAHGNATSFSTTITII